MCIMDSLTDVYVSLTEVYDKGEEERYSIFVHVITLDLLVDIMSIHLVDRTLIHLPGTIHLLCIMNF